MVTIYDIAAEAGVSASTVSRVMNDKPGVNAVTRAKIKKLLQKYSFSPNETARGLVMQSSKMVGILLTDIRGMHYTDGSHYIQKELTELGYCCIIFNTGPGDEAKCHFIDVCASRRVEGVFLIGSSFETPAVKKAIEKNLRNVPVIMINGYFDLPNVYGILSDERGGVRDCVRYLERKNRKKNAYVYDALTPSGEEKRQGFIEGMQEIGQESGHWIYQVDGTLESGYEGTKRILAEHPDVEGIVYSVDLIAVGGIRALRDSGVSVPEQVAVIGIDNCLYGELCYPKLTSLDNKLLDSSQMGVRILIDYFQGKSVTKKMMLFSEINEREST